MSGQDQTNIWINYLSTLGWAGVGIISTFISLLLISFWLEQSFKWKEEIKRGNISVAIVAAATILSFAIVIGFIVTG